MGEGPGVRSGFGVGLFVFGLGFLWVWVKFFLFFVKHVPHKSPSLPIGGWGRVERRPVEGTKR